MSDPVMVYFSQDDIARLYDAAIRRLNMWKEIGESNKLEFGHIHPNVEREIFETRDLVDRLDKIMTKGFLSLAR